LSPVPDRLIVSRETPLRIGGRSPCWVSRYPSSDRRPTVTVTPCSRRTARAGALSLAVADEHDALSSQGSPRLTVVRVDQKLTQSCRHPHIPYTPWSSRGEPDTPTMGDDSFGGESVGNKNGKHEVATEALCRVQTGRSRDRSGTSVTPLLGLRDETSTHGSQMRGRFHSKVRPPTWWSRSPSCALSRTLWTRCVRWRACSPRAAGS
jgi:hypothetical protein